MLLDARSNCKCCANYLQNRRCKAFPEHIPEDLWTGKNLHRAPCPNDQGIMYESKPFDYAFLEITDDDLK